MLTGTKAVVTCLMETVSAVSVKIASGWWRTDTGRFGRAAESIFHLGGQQQKEIFLIYMKLMTNIYLSGPDSLSTPIHNHGFWRQGFAFFLLSLNVHSGVILLIHMQRGWGEVHKILLLALCWVEEGVSLLALGVCVKKGDSSVGTGTPSDFTGLYVATL